MAIFHPERWKNVASGQVSTNASQRSVPDGPSCPTVMVIGQRSGCLLLLDSKLTENRRILDKDPIHAVPPKLGEQSSQPRLHAIEIRIVANAGFQSEAILLWLPGIAATRNCLAKRSASERNARSASVLVAAIPPYTQNGVEISAFPNNQLFTCPNGNTP